MNMMDASVNHNIMTDDSFINYTTTDRPTSRSLYKELGMIYKTAEAETM